MSGIYMASLVLAILPASFSGWAISGTQHADTAASSSQGDSPVSSLSSWKRAILDGDASALATFYSTTPPAEASTPQGKSIDPAEEPQFWSGLAAKGLSRIELKVLDVAATQPGVVGIALRAEMAMASNGRDASFVVSPLEQFWVKQNGAWRIVRTHRGDLIPAPPLALPEPATPNIALYPGPEKARSQINAALQVARKENKRVLVIFGANWCFDCHVLDAAFHTARIAPLIQSYFVTVKVNIGDGDKNLDLAKKYGTPVGKGVPAIAVLDPNGRLLTSQKQGEFQSVIKLGPDDIVRFLNRWKPAQTP